MSCAILYVVPCANSSEEKTVQSLAANVVAFFVTCIVFVVVTVKQGFRRWFGLKGLFFPQINDTIHNSGFHIPSDIQRRFRRVMFWRTMFKNPFLWEKSAQRVHEDMMGYIRQNNWKPVPTTTPDVVEWSDIFKSKNDFYREYVVKQKPCIIKNAPYDRKLWTTEYIRSIWGDRPMVVHDMAEQGKSHTMTLEEMIEFNKKGDGCAYMSFNRTFFDVNRELLNGTMCAEEFQDLLKKRKTISGDLRVEGQLFISTESTHPTMKLAHTYMHCANNINMFFNIEGRKRWVLVDPEFSLCVYPSTFFRRTAAFFSLIKAPAQADSEMSRFPLYEYCPKYDVDLEEGDVLFIPCWWWHSIDTLTPATLSIAERVGITAFGILFPGGMRDPNTLFTSLQVCYPGFKREVFDAIRTKIGSRKQKYDGKTLRELDLRQETEKEYDIVLTHKSEETVRMWRPIPVPAQAPVDSPVSVA